MKPEAVVRKLFELDAKGDLAGIAELLDPEVVWFGTRGGLDADRVARGPEEFIAYLQEIEQTWEQLDAEVEQVVESGETVVAFLREAARGRGGLDVQNETAVVISVRQGRITEARGYLDRAEAPQAVGLSE